MNFEKDDHKSADYDRQACAYQCGRASRWRKPCWQGPGAGGSCGGVAECVPLRRGERFYCQRPDHAGGACKQGPLPDGGCSHTHTPCRPVAGIRKFRGRLTLIGLLLIIALITIFSNRDPGSEFIGMINPGELSSSHSGFPVSDKCENCHEPHSKEPTAWFMSAFEHQDLTRSCVQCHKLTGPERAPHNKIFDNSNDEIVVECKACHQEHKGSEFDISRVSNQICASCHEKKFTSLAQHVDFSENYPHQQPQNIFFDHSTHLDEYFVEEEWLAKEDRDAEFAAQASAACSTCHKIEDAKRDVPIRDYEQICAGCHGQQIAQRTLTILTPDEVSPALMGLITAEGDDIPDSEDAAIELIEIISDQGIDGMMEIVEAAGTPDSVRRDLFRGLNPTALRATAKAWIEEETFEAESTANEEIVGWKTGENDDGAEAVMYQPGGHADAGLQVWIELYLGKFADDPSEVNEEALDSLMDRSAGPGACGKCHASLVGAATRGEKVFKWGRTVPTVREYTSGFSHRPHIDLLGRTEGCEACHKPSESADYPAYFKDSGIDTDAYESSFTGIELQTCANCHNEKRVPADCQLCHSYHREVGFQLEYQKQEKERLLP